MEKKILFVGDIHGRFEIFNEFLHDRKKEIDSIYCLGEFGYWPDADYSQIENGDIPLYWIDGNHEQFDLLEKRKTDEIAPNIFYIPRGTVEVLSNGMKTLFIGGAASIDRRMRTPGFDWFPQEEITNEDIDKSISAIDKMSEIDLICSHTCPIEFDVIGESPLSFFDPSAYKLSILLRHAKPKHWLFAHWHQFKTGLYENTEWTALNMLSRPYYENNFYKYL